MNDPARTFVTAGTILLIIGLLFSLIPKLPTIFGKLPGDLTLRYNNVSLYFPLTTCLLLSVIFSFVMWFLKK